jgi:glucose/arabinose dehydrogenase
VYPDGRTNDPLLGIPSRRSVEENGFHDIALDPDFEFNRTLYFTYWAPPEGMSSGPVSVMDYYQWYTKPQSIKEQYPFFIGKVARAKLSEDNRSIENVIELYDAPGRRIAATQDGYLFITTAAVGNKDRLKAQDTHDVAGKVLRLRSDGSIPDNNPYADNDRGLDAVFSFGHRDPDGIAIAPGTADVWISEHGPVGGDEINIVVPGENYGWPYESHGSNGAGQPVETEPPDSYVGGMAPVHYWTTDTPPSLAPSGLHFYEGKLFPAWSNSVFTGSLAQRHLLRLEVRNNEVVSEEQLLVERGRRVRDVTSDSDGAIYVLTDSDLDRKTGSITPGELLRITPANR